jgi:hypothetical protein
MTHRPTGGSDDKPIVTTQSGNVVATGAANHVVHFYDAPRPGDLSGPAEPSIVAVSIYLDDEGNHSYVEAAVEEWLSTASLFIDAREDPVYGSWFRRMKALFRAATPAAHELALTGLHVADSHLVQGQDAYVTATLLQNVGPVLTALQPTKDAVIRAGALLILKIEWEVGVFQLTAAQQAILDHQPQLLTSPKAIIVALELFPTDSERGASIPEVAQVSLHSLVPPDMGGDTAAERAN